MLLVQPREGLGVGLHELHPLLLPGLRVLREQRRLLSELGELQGQAVAVALARGRDLLLQRRVLCTKGGQLGGQGVPLLLQAWKYVWESMLGGV